MRKFQEAKDMEDTITETVAAMLTFDENGESICQEAKMTHCMFIHLT